MYVADLGAATGSAQPNLLRAETEYMNNSKTNVGDGAFSSFAALWNAVASFSVRNMGVRAILLALRKLAGSKTKADELGLESTLRCYESADQIQEKALRKDPVAFAELLAMATTLNAMVTEVTDEHPEMVRPFARVSVTWPINQPCYEWSKEGSPQERLRALGFGKDVKGENDEKLRRFNSGCGLVALLLHIFVVLRALVAGDRRGLGFTSTSEDTAREYWSLVGSPTLDAAVGRLSDLPIREVQELQAYRNCRTKTPGRIPDVSGDIRFEIKKWFLRIRPLVAKMVQLGTVPTGSKDSR